TDGTGDHQQENAAAKGGKMASSRSTGISLADNHMSLARIISSGGHACARRTLTLCQGRRGVPRQRDMMPCCISGATPQQKAKCDGPCAHSAERLPTRGASCQNMTTVKVCCP